MTTLPDADWASLADILAQPEPEIGNTDFRDLLLADEGYTEDDGTWRARIHRLDVRLHPFGIGPISEPVGGAHCTCDRWDEWAFRYARTPHLLPYGQLAAWIAEHAHRVGAPAEIADVMSGIEVLRALTVTGD